jgi:hypothetical protein
MKNNWLQQHLRKHGDGQWFPQGSFFVATFVTGGQVIAPKCPTFLNCKPLCPMLKNIKPNKKDKLKVIEKIIRLFVKREKTNITIVPIQRNEICFCGSGLKYKRCHAVKLEPKNKIACKLIDNDTGKVEMKIFKRKSLKTKSNLRWVNIGVGSYDKIE